MSRTKIGQGRALSKPIQWLLRDEFSDTRAAGAVNGTPPTPGPGGVRTVTDTNSKLSVGGGIASFATGGAGSGDPGIWYPAIARIAGRLMVARATALSDRVGVGFDSDQSGNHSGGNALVFILGFGVQAQPLGVSVAAAPSAGVYQNSAIGLRSTGAIYFLVDSSNNWVVSWVSGYGTNASMYCSVAQVSASCSAAAEFIRVPADLWLPIPLTSDGFGSSFGTTDGAGHAEGVTGGIGSGGGNVAWTQQAGTYANSAGKAAAATLSGGVAVATVPLPTKDVFAKVKVTRSAGAGGLTLRWTDSSNYLYAEHDGTNAYLKQVLSGSTTTLITAAATYSAGAEIVADLNGTAGRLYWNNALVGTTSSINSGLTATAHGLRSTDTGGIQLDDFVVYAKGTNGEYNLLNRYANL